MEVAAHIEALRHEGELMAQATESAGPDAPVPTCPEWSMRDLVRHTGGVHRWATGYVAEARKELWDVDLDDVVGTWPDDAALARWLRDGCVRLADALATAPPDLECWTFLRAPSPLAMWARRQAHETAVHRVDAELAAARAAPRAGAIGAPVVGVSPFAATFAADGIDELLTCFVTRRSTGLRSRQAMALTVRCSDDEQRWTLHIDEDGATARATLAADEDEAAPEFESESESAIESEVGTGPVAATVRGRAADLYLALWNRGGAEHLTVDGNPGALELFLDSVRVRWS